MTTTLPRTPADPPAGTGTADTGIGTDPPPPSGTAAPSRRGVHRAALVALLAGSAVLYLWGLSASGWANGFYSAASQAGAASWKAWFFGSSDAANLITVDKTPAALWVTGLSARIFGLSSWSILVPQALMGVATVWLLYATVRRTAGPGAGLIAGAAMALTPVAVLMFRYNNPDALLTLLLVGAAYATLRAVQDGGRARWLVLAGTLIGLGFLTKMAQAFLIVPTLAAVWLIAAPIGVGRRLRGLVIAAIALVVSAGWWMLAVALWPAADRPYIGGSQTNSVLELALGYNGFGRLTGDEVGSTGGGVIIRGPDGAAANPDGAAAGPGGGASGGWGETGLTRLFDTEFGAQASWLLPAALVLMVALLWWSRRTPRTHALRAATLVWGGWLVTTWLLFSLMAGIFHAYYLVVVAPPIAALVGIGAIVAWRHRASIAARGVLAVVVALSAGWAFVLLRRAPQWQPWLAWVVLAAGILAACALVGVHRVPRRVGAGVAVAALLACLAGPAGYSLATATTPHTGAIPSAGPAGATRGPGGGGKPIRFAGGDGAVAAQGQGTAGGPGTGPPPSGQPAAGQRGPGRAPGGGPGFMLGGSSLLQSPTPDPALTVALRSSDGTPFTWVAATVGSNAAAGYQLATGEPVMALGGFNGTDPAPTLEQFQQLVALRTVHWFVDGMVPTGTGGGSDAAQRIDAWVKATFPSTTVGDATLYDLTAAPVAAGGSRS